MATTFAQMRNIWADFPAIADQARKAHQAAQEAIAELMADDRYSAEYKQQLIADHQAKAAQILTEARDHIDVTRRAYLNAAERADAPTGGATEQLLAETRQQRAWERIRPQLDAGRKWQTIANEAATARDGAALVAMRSELPAWLQANRPHPSGLTGTAITEPEMDVDGLLRQLDIATFRALGDDGGHGTAARARVHVAAWHPVGVAKLNAGDPAMAGDRLGHSIALKQAEQQAAAVESQLSAPAAA